MPRGIVEAFEKASSVKQDKPLLVTGSGTLTYGGLVGRGARLAGLLKTAGVEPGGRAIVSSKDEAETVAIFLCLLRNGVAPILLDPRLPSPEARALISASKAVCAFIDPELKAWALDIPRVFELTRKATKAGLLSRLASKKEGAGFPSILEDSAPADLPDKVPGDSDAYIMFTSGTTSRPKGVRISHSALFHHLGTLSRQFGFDEGSRILNILPLNHVDGLVQGPLAAFFNCAAVYRPFEFSIQRLENLVDIIYRERITHFVAVPTILSLINRLGQGYEDGFSTGDLRFVISTAAYLEKNLWESFEKRFRVRVANVYGLTETVTGGLFSGPGDSDRCIGTIGKPIDCEAKIIRDNGTDAADGEPGELLLRGGNIMTGYFEDPESTARALEGGWLHTGDIAVRSAEGFFSIVGRKKNIIISGGLNIQPEEVTEVLKSHPDVVEAITFGVEDDTWGEKVISCVALAKESGEGQTALVEFCRSRLAHYKVPQRIYIFPELPKGPSGKVQIPLVKKMVLESGSRGQSSGQDLRGKVIGAAAASFKAEPSELSPHSTPADLPGWDSLAHLQFVVALEEAFKIRLAPTDIVRIESIGDAERIVGEKLSG